LQLPQIIRDYFIVIGYEDIGVLWPKYSTKLLDYSVCRNMDFQTFMSNYMGQFKPTKEAEKEKTKILINV
jgi:hypothetical protein